MKTYIYKIQLSLVLAFMAVSCTKLDLSQPDVASSGNFYQTKEQFRQGLNEGYRSGFWIFDKSQNGFDDDFMRRTLLEPVKQGSISSEYDHAINTWTAMYKGITRMLVVLKKIEEDTSVLTPQDKETYKAEASCILGAYWSWMINHFGDVPFYEEELSIEESFVISRTSKSEILQKIYNYFDVAIAGLPVEQVDRDYLTKGAAYALKARAAIYQNDYATAATAAKGCMDLGVYDLHPNFGELFKTATRSSDEIIFQIPRSVDLGEAETTNWMVQDFLQRNLGGYLARNPTWELLASFECTDGLPIDESPLFDPLNPFKNRDPRCAMTIIPFGSLEDGDGLDPSSGYNNLGIEYTPHPLRKQVLDYTTGNLRRNNDTQSVAGFASFNGLGWKKGVDEGWLDYIEDSNLIWMRYADVLLIYAEAKIELNQIDQTVLDAINEVKSRAYNGTGKSAPLVTTTNQNELRLELRNERRMEFANEGLRYMDLIRWRLAEKALSRGIIGQLAVSTNTNPNVVPTGPLMDNVVNPGKYFWGLVPEIDDQDGLPDFTALLDANLCRILVDTDFPERQYLWPIPASERLLNKNLTQNDGY
ncbi:RagB/SusD family nutrient uptake outer membrane protein [Aestuariibaculum suncheonense]|uniref:RagB/SusD family nutrient uptake outer membrane protein n=1 Tax=Aestuariibaculum suncheonense TaxID=1028745 RepID=A0A8J6Q9M2_9FLAO|nr:RagB/SusD family nutrient uptake outer membrane protein [Aestuariibaculum suncheonense]MBD0833928.1 RagB/SusD family nutrient uptake outer membrane protein [Aestuariibaculum suncheonense]